MSWVAHIYLAGFYSAVQAAKGALPPEQPLIILRRNRVLDRCARAAAFGVKLRSSRRHAVQCCPHGLFVNYTEEDYRQRAGEILSICLEYTPVIEPVAENEFYLELAGPHTPDQALRELTVQLVPAFCRGLSVGIGRNKFLARAANMALAAGRANSSQDACPQDPRALIGEPASSFYWLKGEPGPEAAGFLSSLPITYLWPLEDNIKQRLIRLGFGSIGQLAELGLERLTREFPAQAGLLTALCQGQDFLPVFPLYPPKQITAELKFPEGISDYLALERCLCNCVLELKEQLEEQGCRRLILQIQQEKGLSSSTRSFSRPQNNPVTLQEVLKALLRRMQLEGSVFSLKITADDLRPLNGVQLSLFEDPKALAGKEAGWQVKLNDLVEALGQRFAPKNFHLGREWQQSRRERMLNFWDPLRFNTSGGGISENHR